MAAHYFQANYDSLRPDIDALVTATKAVLGSKSLKAFLRFTLQTGNFINAVCIQIHPSDSDSTIAAPTVL